MNTNTLLSVAVILWCSREEVVCVCALCSYQLSTVISKTHLSPLTPFLIHQIALFFQSLTSLTDHNRWRLYGFLFFITQYINYYLLINTYRSLRYYTYMLFFYINNIVLKITYIGASFIKPIVPMISLLR